MSNSKANDAQVKTASAPNFCPPEVEGATFEFLDEKGDVVCLEFLGLILQDGRSYGFFVQVDSAKDALSDGEILVLEVLDTDEDGQPSEFELVTDEVMANLAYNEFVRVTKDMYTFA